jgi:hypothetical protein
MRLSINRLRYFACEQRRFGRCSRQPGGALRRRIMPVRRSRSLAGGRPQAALFLPAAEFFRRPSSPSSRLLRPMPKNNWQES